MQNQKFLLTVVIPIGHLERDFENLVNFFNAQTSTETEYILVHDFKKDSDSNIDWIAKEYPHLEILTRKGEYGSPGLTRNAGLEIAGGDWICFCDADDFLRVDNVLNELKQIQNQSLLIGQFQRRTSNKQVKLGQRTNSINDVFLDPGFWRMAYRKDLVSKIEFSQIKMGEDIVFLADVLRLKPQIIFSQQIFYDYSIGGPQQTTSNTNLFSGIIEAINLIKNHNPKWRYCSTDRWLIARLALTNLKSNRHAPGVSGIYLNWKALSKSKWLVTRLSARKFINRIYR